MGFVPTQSIPKSGEIRLGYVEATQIGEGSHKYTGLRPYLVVSNNVYNNTSHHAEVIPFTTKRFNSKNPVHVQYLKGEVDGLVKNSTLVVEGRTTLPHSSLSEPIGCFTDDNWKKAAKGMALQTPQIFMAFADDLHKTPLYNHILTAE
jgi:mRNA-degrading endonuclease toxin of MazEF toxin-antitoxin module